MIKTIVAGEDLSRALDRQQQWVDAHGDAPADDLQACAPGAMTHLEALRRARLRETERLTAENGELRRRLRMAKARARSRRL